VKLSCFGKIVWQNSFTKASCMNEREMRERARINYFFKLYSNSYLCESRRKTVSPMKLFWK
jgi:hypothetical protein